MGDLINCAYFCMEYAIDSPLRMYAGGLGILAGDYLKGATQYGYPITAIGLKWKQGYGEQYLDKDGRPYDAYKANDYTGKVTDTGLRVTVKIRKRDVQVAIYKYDADGINNLYLLDTDVPGNDGADRWICGQLYGWFAEERLAQEIVLGVGGVLALEALGIRPDVYHFNEGHALLAGLELLRQEMAKGTKFKKAVKKTREKIVFTTHTPVKEGNEAHALDTMLYMGADCGLNKTQLKALGGNPFNMTVGALRLSKRANGVARLHAQTANTMWTGVKGRSEIIGITNAIHEETWTDAEMAALAARAQKTKTSIAYNRLYDRHLQNKRALVDFVKERTGVELREDVLLIGFSRRAAPYKRSNLLFRDEAFINRLIQEDKLQIVFSGKSHPLDDAGKDIVADITRQAAKYPNNVVFLENYDMEIGRMLTRGSDVWLNNPVRPLEASGTSGMKAAMNGVLNLSVLDGWWPEACRDGENGWQFGGGEEHVDWEVSNERDFHALQSALTERVLPLYYEHQGRWREMMVASILDVRAQFGIRRMLEEYDHLLYGYKL